MAAYKKIKHDSTGKVYAVPSGIVSQGPKAIYAYIAENPSIEEAQAQSEGYKKGAPVGEDRTAYMGTRKGADLGDIVSIGMPLSSWGAKRDMSPVAVAAFGGVDAATMAYPPLLAARFAPALAARFAPAAVTAVQTAGKAAPLASRVAVASAKPIAEGAIGGLMQLPQEIGQTGEVGLESSVAALSPVAGVAASEALTKAAQGAKNLGVGVMESVVKAPKGKAKIRGYEPEAIFEQDLLAGRPTAYAGVKKTLDNIGDRADEINAEYDKVLKDAGKADELGQLVTVDVRNPLQESIREARERVADGTYADIADELEKAHLRWADAAEKIAEGEPLTASQVVNFRKRLGSVAAFGKNLSEREQSADAIFAKILYKNLNATLADKFPEVRKLDSQLQQLYPLRDVYGKAEERLRSNQGVSLADLAAVGAGAGAGFGAGMSLPAAGALLAVRRGSVSPMVAKQAYRFGRAVDETTLGDFGRTATSATARNIGRGLYPTPSGEER